MLNIKVVLSTIMRNYKITSKRKQTDWVLVGQTTLKRREGFLVGLHQRENAPHLDPLTEITPRDINDNECVKKHTTAAS